MPEIGGDGKGSAGGGAPIAEEGIEVSGVIRVYGDPPGENILQGKAERVKLKGATVIMKKLRVAQRF
jgi:hypothetical protein